MSYNKHNHNRRNRNYRCGGSKILTNIGDKGKDVLKNIDENHIIIKQFTQYAAELDDKHDRFEKIIKYGRDITIESKRIIFLLHTLDSVNKTDVILNDAKNRLDNLLKTTFKNIAIELKDQDPYQYLRAYTAGLQEYIEAITFYSHLKTDELPDWTNLQNNLIYNVPANSESSSEPCNNSSIEVKVLVTPSEYILGVADLTGELMRKCINSLAFADIVNCNRTCELVSEIYKGYSGCMGIYSKEIRRKLYVVRQSLIKMENVCYTVKIRGSEIPKHMLVDAVIEEADNYNGNDEDYQLY